MLQTLHITNIAVIKSTDINFSPGLNILTGETGAGKSMIIDSISLLTGARTSKELIRNGADSAMVSAYFTDIAEPNRRAISEVGVECDEEGGIFVQRDITSDGKSKVRLNGRVIPLSLLRNILKYLINIHGQHDNQGLLDPSNHLGLLDAYLDSSLDLTEYNEVYTRMCEVRRKLKELRLDDSEKQRMIDLLRYQLNDIDRGKLKIGEEGALEERKRKIKNIEKISKSTNLIYRALYQNEKGASAYTLIDMAKQAIDKLSDVMDKSEELIEKLDGLQSELRDIAEYCDDLCDDDIGDPDKALDIIEGRLEIINRLKRKYGSSIEEILEFRAKIKKQLDEIELSDVQSAEYAKEYAELQARAQSLAAEITDIRRKGGESLANEIMSELMYLDMGKVKLYVDLQNTELNSKGADEVSFLICTNPGELPKPLSKIASGGELARIMLAMKTVFAKKEGTETLIYDEIDTGISGRTAQKLGFKLKSSAKHSQVICITHSAQVASSADTHLFIEKNEIDGRVETTVRELDENEKINEVARIMGGSEITDKLLSSAKELINQANSVNN